MFHKRFASLLFVLVLLLSASLPAPTAYAQAPTELVVEVAPGNTLAVYNTSSLGGALLRTFGGGNRLAWSGVVLLAEGRNWMQVTAQGITGWASPDEGVLFLADPTRITPNIDLSAVVRPANPMTLYSTPGRGSPTLSAIPAGTQLRVMDGPVVTDLYSWWKVQMGTLQGWVPDTASELEVITPLRVYNYNVCDSFSIRRFGVVGWDSIRHSFPALIPATESIVCLASTNLRGDGTTPIVVVLSRSVNEQQPYDVLRIFEPRGGAWVAIFQQQSDPFARTARLGVYDFAGEGVPMLMWNVRQDGTGGVLLVHVLRYVAGSMVPVIGAELYKGDVQVDVGGLNLIQADYLEGEPNCCPSGFQRLAYAWQTNQFVLVANQILPHPYVFQQRR